jgi:hypothetical protein
MRARQKTAWLPAAGVVLCLGFSACRGAGPEADGAPAKPKALDQKTLGLAVLTVEGRSYSNADFEAYVRRAGGGEPTALEPVALSRLFDRFVDEKLVLESARRQGVALTEDDKRTYLAKMAFDGQPGGPDPGAGGDEVFDAALAAKYAAGVLQDIVIGEDEIAAYYEQEKKDFLLPERVRVSQILLESEDRAVEALRRLERADENAFRSLARAESRGPEAARGGEMGVFRIGDLPADMEKAIFSLPEGRLSRVFESSYGYHIFRLDRRLPPQLLTLEEAAPAIRTRLLDRKIEEVLARDAAELRRTLTWQSSTEALFFAYQRNDT